MTISARIREERQRLGMSQTTFAGLAGVTKSAQIKWEGGTSSAPTAPALAAWAEAGADVLYILIGRRTGERPDNAFIQIDDQLSGIRRDLLDPYRHALTGESNEHVDQRVASSAAAQLSAMLKYDTGFMSPEMREEVEYLLNAATNSAVLALYRAADHAQNRAKRRQMKERLTSWLDNNPFVPNDTTLNLLTMLAIEFAVPIRHLIDLFQELHDEVYARYSRGQDSVKPPS